MPVSDKGLSFPFRFTPAGHTAVSAYEQPSGYRHIRESIQQILLTEPGERVMEQNFGCALKELIFEPIDITLYNLIIFRATNALNRWENRIEINSVTVSKPAKDSLQIDIDFTVLSTRATDSISITRS